MKAFLLATLAAAGLTLSGPAACARIDAEPSVEESADANDFRAETPLREIAEAADRILLVRILDAGADAFAAQVLDAYAGNAIAGERIRIAYGRYNEFDPRWAAYAEEQTVVVFLEADDDSSAPYRILGENGEGEFPVEDGTVFIVGHFIDGLPVERHALKGGGLAGHAAPLEELAGALRDFSACRSGCDKLCRETRVDARENLSPLRRALFGDQS
ncbi:MAG TPA: hypothetical protein PKM48_10960 [Parvularculaceae bacterium]|nr:hypothetical protein [Parvularculaceae bacterium]HNS85750.1 hypothetical protein [Parvularculaceae bacterium]